MIKFRIINRNNRNPLEQDYFLTESGLVLNQQLFVMEDLVAEFDLISVENYLKSLGYSVKPPSKPKPIPNGCFRIEGQNKEVLFIEGKIEDQANILLDFSAKNFIVSKIEFAEDRFFFLINKDKIK